MITVDNIILGAGISGLAAGQKLKELGKDYIIIEKSNTYGGLCDNFVIDGFQFDKFVHFSFTKNPDVRKFFDQEKFYKHIPNPENYYKGKWIKHPAQNNLYPISSDEKKQILTDMDNRIEYKNDFKKNYEYWLRYQFGDYFAEHFPMTYTRKYWGVDAKELETKWVGNRIYQPTMEEILEGMKTNETPITYYAKEMRYPKKGGFKSFLKHFSNEEKINYNEKVIHIDTVNKVVITDINSYKYNALYSSIPLPEYSSLISFNDDMLKEIDKLKWTSGYIVSLGMSGELFKKNLWDYIYDEDVLPARVYSPSEKSKDNCPKGNCSIQAEIYFKNDKLPLLEKDELMNLVIKQLNSTRIINESKILVKDIRFEKYANIIFDMNIYQIRNKIIQYLNKLDIKVIGRFGEWDYFWTDQSFLSGYNIL